METDSEGGVYITGYTFGDLDGNSNAGGYDAFLTKYDADGTKVWTQLLGTTGHDHGYGVEIDDTGGIYITGYTYGDLEGTNAGDSDIFIARYNVIPEPSTLIIWTILGALGITVGWWRRKRRVAE